jgi:hypothetical protein
LCISTVPVLCFCFCAGLVTGICVVKACMLINTNRIVIIIIILTYLLHTAESYLRS